MGLVSLISGDEQCPADYSPCTCSAESTGELKVQCSNGVTMKEIRNIFSRTQYNPYELEIIPSAEDVSTIPADLLENKSASEIKINCPSSDYILKIHQDAFRSSAISEFGTIVISGCDLSQLDFAFLQGFDKLTVLQITYSSNIHLSGFFQLPNLANLELLDIDTCTGLNDETMSFPVLYNGLTALALTGNGLDDDAMSRALETILESSAEKLEILTINQNPLTKIPDQIKEFTALSELYLGNNAAPMSIMTGSLVFFATSCFLRGSGIEPNYCH